MPPVEDLLARLERERQEADRLYNEALSALDRAIQTPLDLPDAPVPTDETQLAQINRSWNILPEGAPVVDRSLKGRIRAFIWRIVGPPFDAQNRFNAGVVDHFNRNLGPERLAREVVGRLITAVRRESEALIRFESLLLAYLRTIALYVDTKDRSLSASDLRERLQLAEQRIQTFKRELETLPAVGCGPAPRGGRFDGVEAPTYVGFEERFRGIREEVRSRVEDYVPLLAPASNVVDLGCGRGELLELLRDLGISARGVDTNSAMVELCRARGLDVEEGDALSFLDRQEDSSIGGVAAIQVVEHLEPIYLVRVLDAAYRKMRRGAPLILETINPACWMAFFETYIRDPTHERPLHPDTLKYLVEASGFTAADVQFRRPVRETDKLQRVDLSSSEWNATLDRLAAALNDHAEKLNARLFSSTDYFVIARR